MRGLVFRGVRGYVWEISEFDTISLPRLTFTQNVLLYSDNHMMINSFDELVEAVLARKVAFVIAFFVIFLLSYGLLAWLDFLPEPVKSDSTVQTKVDELNSDNAYESGYEEALDKSSAETVGILPASDIKVTEPVNEDEYNQSGQFSQSVTELPNQMIIDSLARQVKILNPDTRTVAGLDNALLSGVVRHPDSALLGQLGTVFLLGHSSYLPTVINKNFQAFNGIQNLKFGDLIKLNSDVNQYTYRVVKVYRAKATEVTVPIAGTEAKLVLATCNSFGSTDDRYIVEASLLSTEKL